MRSLSILRRVSLTGVYATCFLLLSTSAYLWVRGKQQAARVAELVAAVEGISIYAQYEPYAYEPPRKKREIVYDGTLSLVLGGGQRISGYSAVGDPPRYLEWIVPLLGEQAFARVTDIRVSHEEFSDANVPLLLAFPDLQVLNVSYTALTDKGLAQLASLKRLVVLKITGNNLTGASLGRFASCRDLRKLDASDTGLTDEGLAQLASLTQLVELDISAANVAAAALRRLSNCRELRELDIRGTGADRQVVDDLQQALPDCSILWR